MKVSTKYLRDFLSLSNMALVRIHSHQRVRNEEFKEEVKAIIDRALELIRGEAQ